jgi:hypothetical protein
MKILIGRHNGVGDLIMAVPFIVSYLEMGHEVTLACSPGRHDWLRWLIPGLPLIDCVSNPYEDFAFEAAGYDAYLNLNKTEFADDVSAFFKHRPMNQQAIYAFLAKLHQLPLPSRGMSPSRYINRPTERGNETILFAKSTHPSRTLPEAMVAEIRRRRPDIVVDPPGSLMELSERVARARQVIGTDSGGVHLAELFRTPWRVLHTTFDYETRHTFYEYGSAATSLQADAPCSPCRRHEGCDDIICTARFDIDAILAPP